MSGICELMRTHHAFTLIAAVLLGAGCAHYPQNARMKHDVGKRVILVVNAAVARLRAVAGKLLNQSETYRALLRDLASEPLQPARAPK